MKGQIFLITGYNANTGRVDDVIKTLQYTALSKRQAVVLFGTLAF